MKTTLIYLILFASIFGGTHIFAQNTHFVKNGVIEFEKKANMYALLKKRITPENESYMDQAFEQYQKKNPQFKVTKSVLSFNKDKSLYKWPSTEEIPAGNFFGGDPLADLENTVFTNFNAQKSTTEKHVFENKYLVTDTVRKITWKITDETRDIVGYQCRRANAIIMDSIYVVAFYTDQIAVSGGPESFTGLPGMILGVALPHENVTWFATKVSEVAVPEKELMPPSKGKPVDNKGLTDILKGAMKNWGDYAQHYLQAFSL
ncbi:GLPGLI family protein [Pedobacter sp. UYP30]|uniref:GLPGLI family protein n=1 Tax=Pedobacter sp. UYP30 TaxID=1756400 RepID=UPI003397A97D